MSDLNYYPHPSALQIPHRAGLTAWGVVLIVLGGIFALSALFAVASIPIMMAFHPAPGKTTAPQPSTREMMVLIGTGAAMIAGMAGGLLWLGIGSCRGRRWVGPVVVAGGPLIVAFGIVAALNVCVSLVHILANPPPAGAAAAGPISPKALLVFSSAIGLIVALGLHVTIPAVMVWFYRRESVTRTLELTDPVRRWTDGVPVPLLRWMLATGYTAGLMMVAAPAGTYVAFAAVLQGWPARVTVLVAGVLLAFATVGSYRRSTAAWVVGVAVMGVLAASTLTFAFAGDPGEYVRQISEQVSGVPGANASVAGAAAMSGRTIWIGSGLVYGLLALYGLSIRPLLARPTVPMAAAVVP